MNPQPTVLETVALPIELLAYIRLLPPYLVYGTFSLPLAKLVQLKLRSTTLNINLRTIIAITAFLALQPYMFTLLRPCHYNLSKKRTPRVFQAQEAKKVLWFSHSTLDTLIGFTR